MEELNPFIALSGGALIGLSASMLLWLDGRIAGVSGILCGALRRWSEETSWRVLFLLGMICGGILCLPFAPKPGALTTELAPLEMILGGLLVGFGTKTARGCTSGHGVCGIARLSKRSFVATISFLVSGIASVYVIRQLLG